MSTTPPKKYKINRQFAYAGVVYSLSDTPLFTHEQAAEIIARNPTAPLITEIKAAAAPTPKAA